MHLQTYSQRMLCPCHGMLQVVRVDGGVAESLDGYSWKLFVADASIISHTGLSEVRYAEWNPRTGCSRSRIRGTSTASIIEETGERLVSALADCAGRVPFEPLDRLEYWLADAASGKPLALLDSRTEWDQPGCCDSPQWHPGATAGGCFTSEFGDAGGLTKMIKERAGNRPGGFWVERTESGGGRRMTGETLDPEQFPELFLATDWPESRQTRLVHDFLAWQAPWLLQIHGLKPATRRWLEQAAWQRPVETGKLFRLFPKVYDTPGLTVTRVKARVMHTQPMETGQAEPFYPFFNE
jgi:hypothetical protein